MMTGRGADIRTTGKATQQDSLHAGAFGGRLPASVKGSALLHFVELITAGAMLVASLRFVGDDYLESSPIDTLQSWAHEIRRDLNDASEAER